MKDNLWQIYHRYQTFIRYALVGVVGTFVDLAALFVLTEVSGINPVTSYWFPVFISIAFLLAVLSNYILNRLWTFQSQDKNVTGQFFRFLVVSIGGFALTQLLMWVLVSGLGIWYMLSKALTSLFVLTWNFSLNKLWTFRQPNISEQEAAAKSSDTTQLSSYAALI